MLVAGGICLCVTFIGLGAWFAGHEWNEQVRKEGQPLHNMAVAVADTALRNVRALDQAMNRLAERLQPGGSPAAAEQRTRLLSPDMQVVLRDLAASLPPSQAILVVGPDGAVEGDSRGRLTSPTDVSDQDYFRKARAGSGTEVFVTDPVVGPLSRKLTVHLARRLEGPGGEFAGLLLGAIEVRDFEDLIGRSRLSHDGTINLWRRDGMLLARSPSGSDGIGRIFRNNPAGRSCRRARAMSARSASSAAWSA